MQLSDLLETCEVSPGQVSVAVTPDWMQGRNVFGGLQAAIAHLAMRTLVPDMPLRTLQATFMAPPPESRLTAKAAVLRQGKNSVHVESRLMDGDQTLGIVIGVFGSARESSVSHRLQQPVVAREGGTRFPWIPGVTPEFTQHFDGLWLRGGFPYTGNPSRELVVEFGIKDRGLSTEAHVLAMADFIPPIALAMLKKPAPGSTLTWMLEFMDTQLTGLPLQGWRMDAEMIAAGDGYTHQTAVLWGPQGQPVALSRQNMVVFG